EQNLTNYGLEYSWVDTSDVKNIENAIKANTKMIFVETPTNPMLMLTDLEAVADICKRNNLLSVADNTFMSPYFQNPLGFGIDIVLHSSTKYLNGHSDVIGGIIITSNEKVQERIHYIQNAAGGVPSPFDCWLVLRSTKTLAVRMKQHDENARAFADWLVNSGTAERVIYPGLKDHPQFELAKKQMRGYGGMVSADFGTLEKAKKVLNNVKIFLLAESLGGVESLVCHPASMTHATVPIEDREKFGLTDGLVRFSVGIEDIEDLIEDLKNTLQ
ncbi:MAG: aminotransferase class I/II-fold pyridoxal phosphate-dependent enzyme, partial [Ignavibacteriaceae bacterium]